MTSILEFRLGTDDRASLKLKIRGRERPDATDAEDRNWLQGAVEVCSGHMAGTVGCSLRAEDLADFRGSLASLTVAGPESPEAVLTTMEHRLGIQVAQDAGVLAVAGHIADGPDRNRFEFRFRTDAAELPKMLQSLDAILDAYLVS